MNKRLHWDDLRIVLAVAEAGSLSGAGRRLGLSHATVFRRLGDIESRVGVALFERGRGGYAPTPAGEEAAEGARRMEAEVLEVERKVAGRDLKPFGSVRLTTTDALLAGLLSPVLAAFREAYPDIALEIAVPSQLFNLSRREADVALRPTAAPPETLVGRRVGAVAQAVYGRKDRRGDSSESDLREAEWVGPDESMGYRVLDQWMAKQDFNRRCRYRVDTTLGMAAAVRAGAGVAVLPCYLADGDGALCRIGDPVDALRLDLWLLTHPDLRRAARVRALMDFLADALKRLSPRLNGGITAE